MKKKKGRGMKIKEVLLFVLILGKPIDYFYFELINNEVSFKTNQEK